MRAFNIFVGMLLGLALVGWPPARAQAAPDAGTVRQQFEQALKPALPPAAAPLQRADAVPLPLAADAVLTVGSFRFTGNTLLNEARLQAAVQPWLARPVGFQDLQQAAQAVAQAYRKAGWIVRTLLPAQDVTDGTVTIQVVEARFAGARIDGTPSARVPADLLLAHIAAQQPRGQPLRADALDRALLLADDLPGVALSGTLEPGAQDGETALLLNLRDEPLLGGEGGIDNHGARSTGAARAVVSARLHSPLGRGDLLRADAAKSRGSRYARLGYSLPVGADGWRLGLNASSLGYRLVGDEFSALAATGSSASVDAELTWAALRSRERNLYLALNVDSKRYRNMANDALQSRYQVGTASLSLNGNLFDGFGGGGANGVALSLSAGRVRQGAPDAGENPALGGGYGKLRYSLSRQQVLAPALSVAGAISGQYARKDLDSSERFYLGGPFGVRAYPVNEGGGSRAALLNLELRWRVAPAATLSVFYDAGRAASAATAPDITLKGYGAAVAWSAPGGVDVKAMLATRDGGNPNPTASGKDQDGSLKHARLWVQVSLAF